MSTEPTSDTNVQILTPKAIPLADLTDNDVPSFYDLRDLAIGPDQTVYLMTDAEPGRVSLPAGCQRIFSPRISEDDVSFVARTHLPSNFVKTLLDSQSMEDTGRPTLTGGVSGNLAVVYLARFDEETDDKEMLVRCYEVRFPDLAPGTTCLSRSVPFRKNASGVMEPFGFQEVELEDGSTQSLDIPAIEVPADTYESIQAANG